MVEGNRKGYAEEWAESKKAHSDRVAALRKDVRGVINKIPQLQCPPGEKRAKQMLKLKRRVPLPPGARTVTDGLEIVDLKVIDLRKRSNVAEAKLDKRKRRLQRLIQRYQTLVDFPREANIDEWKRSEVVQTDKHHLTITAIETDIRRATIRWIKAEHIQKKYHSIKTSLMNDGERFECLLEELQQAIDEQQVEIGRLDEAYKEAVGMRNSTKQILEQQEHATMCANQVRAKEKQSLLDRLRNKTLELDALERKVSAIKRLASQDESAYCREHDKRRAVEAEASNVEQKTKVLLHAIGVGTAGEVIPRCIHQHEASEKLRLLRVVMDKQKSRLQEQCDLLKEQLEELQFDDESKGETAQDKLERMNQEMRTLEKRNQGHSRDLKYTQYVSHMVRQLLVELLLKLCTIEQTIDVSGASPISLIDPEEVSSGSFTLEKVSALLDERIKLGRMFVGDSIFDDNDLSPAEKKTKAAKITATLVPMKTGAKRQDPVPSSTLRSLMKGRRFVKLPSIVQDIEDEEENASKEIPSRDFLKQQADEIVETSLRRKSV